MLVFAVFDYIFSSFWLVEAEVRRSDWWPLVWPELGGGVEVVMWEILYYFSFFLFCKIANILDFR